MEAVGNRPQIGELEQGLWYCQGFRGSGMKTTTAGGEVVASAIAENDERDKLFEPFGLDYASKPFGPVIAQLTYWGYQAGNKLKGMKYRE